MAQRLKHLPAMQETRETWVRSLSQEIPKKGNAKECSNYHTIALISDAIKIMLKILQARVQQYMDRELPDVQAGVRKGRGTRGQIANIHVANSLIFFSSLFKCSLIIACTLYEIATLFSPINSQSTVFILILF